MTNWLQISAALALWLLLPVLSIQIRPTIHVPADYHTISEALAAAPRGAVIQVSAGDYNESLVIEKSVTIRGIPPAEAIVRGTEDGPVITIVNARDVTISHLTITGGQQGIIVRGSQSVTILRNVITGNHLIGVKAQMSSVDIVGNTINSTLAPYGRGIHIANTNGLPKSRVIGNVVTLNARSGIVTNMVSRVLIINNTVTGNGQHGIAVTEMSDALVAGNVVDENGENGIYISDASMALVCDNTVSRSALAAKSHGDRYGNGITVDFGAQVELHRNILSGNANHGLSILDVSSVLLGANTVQDNASDSIWLEATSSITRNAVVPDECR